MSSTRYENRNLDLMRAIAVTIVLVYHCLPPWRIYMLARVGIFGVLIFFVHTALVLMMSLERISAGGLRYFRAFYIQRAFRIYPLSIVCVVAVVAFGVPWAHWFAFTRPSTGRVIANLLLVQNLIGNSQETSVSGPLWSLPYEVQMYVLLPMLFWLLVRQPSAITLSAMVVFSMCVSTLETSLIHSSIGLTMFFPCFMGGVVAYFLRSRVRPFLPAILWPATIAAFGIAYYFAPTGNISAWVACLGLGCVLPFFTEIKSGVVATAAHLTARYSYGIYLAHIPLLWLCFYRLSYLSYWTKWALFITLLPTTAILLYVCIEHPMIRVGRRLALRVGAPKKLTIPATVAAAQETNVLS